MTAKKIDEWLESGQSASKLTSCQIYNFRNTVQPSYLSSSVSSSSQTLAFYNRTGQAILDRDKEQGREQAVESVQKEVRL